MTKEFINLSGGARAIEKDLAILSDEIYLHYVYDDAKFISTASLSEEVKDRTCLLYTSPSPRDRS